MNSIDNKHIWSNFVSWVVDNRKVILIVSGAVVFVAAAAITTYFLVFNKPADKLPEPTKPLVKAIPIKYYSPLTGALVESESITKQAVTGVMVENSPEARPQSGIKDAGVVFEAICEGGITRFLLLYQSEKPQLIGPVRSVRMYYISWAAAFDASIAHVGGNADALAEVGSGRYRDIDQFANGDSYWRSDDRYAPHNMYTSFANLDALNASKGYTTSTFTGFKRIDGVAAAVPTATNVNVTISSDLFNSSYIYDPLTNTYARSQAGEPHLDNEAGQITPSVVIAMFVDEYTGASAEGSEEYIDTINTGRAVIFQNGVATEATWTKTGQTDQIKFTDATGIEVPLIRGQTWIAAVPNGNGDVVWN